MIKEFGKFYIFLLMIFILNLGFNYYKFSHLKQVLTLSGKVISINKKISKNKKNSFVLKVSTDDFTFFTKIYKNLNISLGDQISLKVILKNFSFKDYLSISFLPSFDQKIIKKSSSFKMHLARFIAKQNKDKNASLINQALFLATPLNKEIRTKFSNLGISHLLAISGFHLGIIYSFLYFVLFLIYKQIHKFMPYRNSFFDINLIIFCVLFFYLVLLEFTPSFLRAYFMALFTFILACKNIKIISFNMLFLVASSLIAFNIKLLFSLSFYLSVCGVFYIFLYIKYLKFNKLIDFFLINIYVYFCISLIVVYFFKNFSPYSLLSIIFTPLFTPFYIIDLILHIFGIGYFSNFIINFLLSIKTSSKVILIGKNLFLFYNLLSILAIRSKILAIILPLFSAFFLFF